MQTKDTGIYSDSAQFETEVFPNVYWVPLNTLGRTRYTNEEMTAIAALPPEEKRSKISNLYEAVQLFQVSSFRGVLDNINHWLGDQVLWQTHKAPLDAVVSNEGCCATDTNWLAYFLHDTYDALGCFCYANEDGNGHITTCIRQDDCFFFLDMMMCRNDSQPYLCHENGALSAWEECEWAGFLYRCKDPLDFCKFHVSRCQAKSRPVPIYFYMRETASAFATGLELGERGLTFLVPKNENPRLLYCDAQHEGGLLFVDLPDL